ncbi:hypothetical protein BZJ18_11010 [Salinivibrio sp. IB872]|nr:hypothetical protein BZJ18_11010 [Salinivibrio sp. IB872]
MGGPVRTQGFARAETSGGAALKGPQCHYSWHCAHTKSEYQVYIERGEPVLASERGIRAGLGALLITRPSYILYRDMGATSEMDVYTQDCAKPLTLTVVTIVMFDMLRVLRELGVLVTEDNKVARLPC